MNDRGCVNASYARSIARLTGCFSPIHIYGRASRQQHFVVHPYIDPIARSCFSTTFQPCDLDLSHMAQERPLRRMANGKTYPKPPRMRRNRPQVHLQTKGLGVNCSTTLHPFESLIDGLSISISLHCCPLHFGHTRS